MMMMNQTFNFGKSKSNHGCETRNKDERRHTKITLGTAAGNIDKKGDSLHL